MALDRKNIETIVEIITREVLVALEEEKEKQANPDGAYCKSECADGICVTTCYDKVGQVIDAGAERLSTTLGAIPEDINLAPMIDHTLLKPEATTEQVAQLCYEAKKYSFASVCVNPAFAKLCGELLKDCPVKVCVVIGFPLGATSTESKVYEARQAVQDGATELDMVINIGALKARDLQFVARDILSVVNEGHAGGALIKVIIETALLNDEEKTIACLLSKEAGADFVKTSTGFSSGGATVEDVALMRRVVGEGVGVKAAGGIRTREDAINMVKAGATRIGASAGVKIISTAKTGEQSQAGSKGY